MNAAKTFRGVLVASLLIATAYGQRQMFDLTKLVQSVVWSSLSSEIDGQEQQKEELKRQQLIVNRAMDDAIGAPVANAAQNVITPESLTPAEKELRTQLAAALADPNNPDAELLRRQLQAGATWTQTLAAYSARLSAVQNEDGRSLTLNERLALEQQMGLLRSDLLIATSQLNEERAQARALEALKKEQMRREMLLREQLSDDVGRLQP